MKVITIAREFGAGGRTIGREVANRLGIQYYDRDLIMKTAEESKFLTAEDIRKFDEKLPVEVGFAQSLFNFYAKPLSEQIFDAQSKAIRKIAETESCVMVGRNAEYILKEFDHVLKVFVCANKEWKITHMKEQMPELSRDEIEAQMNSIDKARKNYTKKFSNQVYGQANNYDMCLNISSIGIDKAVEYIIDAYANI